MLCSTNRASASLTDASGAIEINRRSLATRTLSTRIDRPPRKGGLATIYILTSLQGPSHHGKLSCGEGSGGRLSRSPPPQCQSVVSSKEQKPAPCENPTTMASLLAYQSIHEDAFRLLSNSIVTCSTWKSISVTANRPVYQTERSAPA